MLTTCLISVLKEPPLRFGINNNFPKKFAEIKNGSWDLFKAKFNSPADLLSFAVIDYVGTSGSCIKVGWFGKIQDIPCFPWH